MKTSAKPTNEDGAMRLMKTFGCASLMKRSRPHTKSAPQERLHFFISVSVFISEATSLAKRLHFRRVNVYAKYFLITPRRRSGHFIYAIFMISIRSIKHILFYFDRHCFACQFLNNRIAEFVGASGAAGSYNIIRDLCFGSGYVFAVFLVQHISV